MSQGFTRREFIATSAAIGVAVGLGRSALGGEPEFKTKLHKALIRNHPSEDELKRLKDAGFEGVEAGIVDPGEAEKCRKVAEKLGMRIHCVLRGWAEFNSPDKSKVDETLAVTEAALRSAQAFGADAVLLVPCRTGGMAMPRPWEFLIDFDEKTGHISKVTAGDNSPFQDYIAAHNQDPKPLVWTADLKDILPKILRAHETMDKMQNQ